MIAGQRCEIYYAYNEEHFVAAKRFIQTLKK